MALFYLVITFFGIAGVLEVFFNLDGFFRRPLDRDVFHRQNGFFIILFVGFFELWETWNLLCQFLGLNVAVLDVDQRVIDFCWTT